MYIIGITGPSGAGKTTALRVLEDMGGQVFDCDAIYHRLLETDGELLGRIEAAFPGAVRNWQLDRKALGAQVFADPAGLEKLSAITWPAVRREVERQLTGGRRNAAPTAEPAPAAEASPLCHSERSEESVPFAARAAEPAPATEASPLCHSERSEESVPPVPGSFRFAVIDAIGLFESGLSALCTLTVAVVADEAIRVRRLMARDGITEEYARSRVAAQKPASWFAEQADLVLENNGAEAEFAQKCQTELTGLLRNRTQRNKYEFVPLRARRELKAAAAAWFHSKWGVPEDAYLECMDAYLAGETELGWFLCLYGNEIVGGLGVIENDFHDRKDLRPNVCAVYTEKAHRSRGIAGRLLNMAVEDLRSKGISPVYLVTDHTGFYERYGWEFFCHAQGDGENHLTRLYIHK